MKFIYSDEERGLGRIERLDAEGRVAAVAGMDDVLSSIPCFTPGARLLTEQGLKAVSALRPGDRVVTRDNGSRPVLWIGTRAFGWRDLGLNPLLRPVRIAAGAFGDGLPERDLVLSPNHRLVFTADRPGGGTDEGLVRARDLLGRTGVGVDAGSSVAYVQVLFDRHEAVMSEGVWSESFLADAGGLASLDGADRAEVAALGLPAARAARPAAAPASVREPVA